MTETGENIPAPKLKEYDSLEEALKDKIRYYRQKARDFEGDTE